MYFFLVIDLRVFEARITAMVRDEVAVMCAYAALANRHWDEDESSGLDAWASRSWRAWTRKAYAQKLAKIAEFQEASGETSLVG